MSKAKTNEYLKKIADRCEINKDDFHTAPHTFAAAGTLSNGVSMKR